MKKIIPFLLFLALPVSFFYSCNTAGSGKAYTLKMRLKKGDTFKQDLQMDMHMNTSGMETTMKFDFDCSFNVAENDSANTELKITYNKVHTSIDMGKMSGKTNMPDSVMNKANNNMIGKSITLHLSKNNEITDVSGFDELMNSGSTDSAGREMMKKMFSKSQLNSMFGMMFSMYPKQPVKIGETWNAATSVDMNGMQMKVDNKYTLLSVKNGLAEIDINGSIGGNGEMKQSSGLKMDMSGTQKGTITIRMDNGYMHSGSYKMDMKVDMDMMGQKIPMTMKADYTIKGI